MHKTNSKELTISILATLIWSEWILNQINRWLVGRYSDLGWSNLFSFAFSLYLTWLFFKWLFDVHPFVWWLHTVGGAVSFAVLVFTPDAANSMNSRNQLLYANTFLFQLTYAISIVKLVILLLPSTRRAFGIGRFKAKVRGNDSN